MFPPPGGDSQMEWTGMLAVSLRGVNFGFWSSLGRSVQNVIIFSQQGLVKGCTRRNTVLFICLFYKLVSFRGLQKLRPRPDWFPLGVKFKISNKHPGPLHGSSLPPPCVFSSCRCPQWYQGFFLPRGSVSHNFLGFFLFLWGGYPNGS